MRQENFLSNSFLEKLLARLAPLRREVLEHPVYSFLTGEAEVRTFMASHCFAVWDFMSLLKALQQRLTCTDWPWRPRGDSLSRRLLNEIVLGEESDQDGRGGYQSHFELYLEAMREAGADTGRLGDFLGLVEASLPLHEALDQARVPEEAVSFVRKTWSFLETNSPVVLASAFSLGREDLVPKMFHQIVGQLRENFPQRWGRFGYYLDRHILLDGEEHGPMAFRLLAQLCGSDPCRWQEAESAARAALQARIRLWDGIARRISEKQRRNSVSPELRRVAPEPQQVRSTLNS